MNKTPNYLMVAAIDFGTAYSGYAFSTTAHFKLNPLDIQANQSWNAGARQLLSLKTPTCILIDIKKELVSFGYEAENDYADLAAAKKHRDYYFFKRFKMKLYQNKDLNEETRLEDVTGKSLLAIDVFSLSIKALTSHLSNILKEDDIDIKPHEIRWVLTVPAIWPDNAKLFMRKSAQKAGIDDKNLLIALEPEAASILCQYLPTAKLKGAPKDFDLSQFGKKSMVLDLGGGTADITVHEMMTDGRLKELCHASGGDYGGTSIDNAFIQLLIKILGGPFFNKLKTEHPSAYLDLFREFETVKRRIKTTSDDKVNFAIPCATINTLCDELFRESLSSMIQKSPYASTVQLLGDKLRVDADTMKVLFKPTVENIVSLVKDVLRKPFANDVPLILMVGGLSQCEIVKAGLKKAFPIKQIITPEEPELSVLKGAVLFGHKPDYIASRVTCFTYGTDLSLEFDPELHDSAHRVVLDKKVHCERLFGIIMEQNKSIPVGTKVERTYNTCYPFQKQMSISLYVSKKATPKYVDEEGSMLICEAAIDIPFPQNEERGVDFEFIFGNTEIIMQARDKQYGPITTLNFRLH